MAPDELLRGLDESQRRAVTSPARPLAILAPAGSGKTRVLTRRIAWRVATEDAEAAHVLALTFTRKAAGSMRERLARLGLRDGIAAGTFHSIAYTQLKMHWSDNDRRALGLLARKGPLLSEVLRSARLDVAPATVAAEIEWAKARLVSPDAYAEAASAASRRPAGSPEAIAQLYADYESRKQRQGVVDFDDLLKLCADALLEDQAFAAAQRWRFRHLFVDEFQDVNALQLRLLDAWRGEHYDLCVVGDPQQAIYGWNGADARVLLRFQTMYPPAELISLRHNYRSTPQILRAATHVLERAGVNASDVGVAQGEGPTPRLVRLPDDLSEAQAIARAVRDRRGPRKTWSSQAVLVRTHAQVGLITEGLRGVGIPHRVRGDADTAWLQHPDVRAGLDLLRRDNRPLATCIPDLEAMAADVEPADMQDSPLAALLQLARDHLRLESLASGSAFCSWLLATVAREGVDGGNVDAVTVATFHSAKGLEWPIVHLAGLEDGFVPSTYARTKAQRAEEARLLYVAMTRAERELFCTWAGQRTFNGKVVERRVCPWLRDLPEPSTSLSSETSEVDWREQIAQQRARLAEAKTAEPDSLAALLSWRDDVARAARIAPAAVIDDRLLEAVADRRPATADELAEIPGMGRLLVDRLGANLLAALLATTNDSSA